ncbi:Mis6-domain-containing protein [Bimuria novae-zelandiae CBS 107.79]|uniref:Mis6-domain-containing protein n=1 Tax=Bimuria novae-zelandiae CBS 107.79 TaxID=1447943 RepID=A0A6A5URQ6_9PLEO|nr:Mis6-domain-containing protein [Bimuria novae-zelandiae CBS 107.79]
MPSIADSERPASLRDALEALERGEQASNTPAKQRAVKVSGVVDVICRHAFDVGLDQESLRTVVQIASVKTELDQTSVTTLIKNLYPAQRVPAGLVVTIVGALGQGKGKPTPGTQNGFVKWLITVHEIIDDSTVLSRLYGVLFGMLDSISIRTSLCHLLSLITLRKHVKPFRIEQLLELARGLGNEPALQGLLRVYKDYYPDIILGSTSASRNSFPPAPDAEWRSRITAIQERAAAEADAGFEQHNGFKVSRKGPKRGKSSAIPDVHTFHANETSVTLEGIDNVEDFVEKLDLIDPPGQMVSFLTDPLLQKYVELRDTPIISRRIQLWLESCLEDQYNASREGVVDVRYLSQILEGLLRHVQYTNSLLPTVQAFLKEYLLVWDGLQNVDTLLSLISYIPIQPFADARVTFLQPLERALGGHDLQSYEYLLGFYTLLFRQWTNQAMRQSSRSGSALEHPDQRALFDLASHFSTLSSSLVLDLPPDSPSALSITSAILTFYEQLSTSSKPQHIPIILPPTTLINLLTLSSSTTVFARITGIVANYRHAFSAHPVPIHQYYPEEVTAAFNSTMRDIHNLLWLSRGLLIDPPKCVGLHCEPELRDTLHAYLTDLDHEYGIQTAFNMTHNPLLASLALSAWLDVENEEIEKEGYGPDAITRHAGPMSQISLERLRARGGVNVDWEAYRVRLLRWLEERGLRGPEDFMFAASVPLRTKYGDQA